MFYYNMTKIISEIGINHNGSIETCKQLIYESKLAGCDYVKIQKRNPDVCVPEKQKNKRKHTPWGEMSYLEYKHKLEFSESDIKVLFDYANSINIQLFASVWDIDSARLMSKYTRMAKLGSASITDEALCKETRNLFDFVIISTGMSTEEEVEKAVMNSRPDVIMHTNSTYPCPSEDLNLRYIEYLKCKWINSDIGYSGHEIGLAPTYAAIMLGATWVERHVTLDKSSWGSDQKSSISVDELRELVNGIRSIERSILYNPGPRILFGSENSKKLSLRNN
jgi:N-acetylneuraminate synthase